MSKIATYINPKTFKFSDKQIETFNKLESMNINVSKFVRIAIKEKIEKDFKNTRLVKRELSLVKLKDLYPNLF